MRHHRVGIASYLAVFIGLCDQFTKWWVVQNVMSPPSYYPVAPHLNFTLVWNKGVTFGVLSHMGYDYMRYFLIATAIAILGVLGHWLWRTTSVFVALALGAIMGGAIGNIIDRIRYGAVVDFIDAYYGNYHWYTFNLADAAIVSGVALLILDSLVRRK